MKKNEPTKKQALKIARILGCEGAHENGNGWMPCLSNEEYVAIKKGKEEYLKVRATKKFPPKVKIVHRTQRLETKSDAYYESRSDAANVSKLRGCGGVRTVVLGGKKYYSVCDHRAPKKGWENLAEKPITGIATLPGGGLVTGSFSGKGFVPNVGRSTDPDTFSDPDSARIRARNLGCIGIRRYSARDGKLVWLPCTNVSDYNRLIGVRGDNSLRNNPRRQGSNYRKKILGRPIGGVAEFDGDVDGHVTGPDGEDNIPFVAPKILKHAGSQYLKSLDEQKLVLEKEFGDLSKTENATRAFKQTFKNLREFNMFDPKKTSLSALELAHTISLLHLGKDKRVADTVHYIGDARAVIGEKNWNGTNAASILGFSGEYGGTKIQHSIVFNKEVTGYPGGAAGWGDAIASQMKQQGASTEDIDKFWGMYVANHEWVHTEHHVSAMEHLGAPINSSAYDFITKLAESDGVDKKSFDLQFQQKLKELKLKQPDTDEEEIRDDLIFLMLSRNASKFMELVTSSKNDDLSRGELSQLGGRYPSTVSLYATENFAELVAEKSSASRMGHPAGNPNNPAWRKLEAFVRGGVTQEVATEGMTRQQRRQLERANQNKKELDKNNYFDGIDINDVTESDTDNMFILSTCTGFPHSLKERQEKSLKILGTPIGGVAEFDGDVDGFSTGPDGEDNVPVAPKKIIDRFKSSVESRWGSDRYEGEKMFIEPKWKIDEMPALKDISTKALLGLADRLKPPHYSLESIDEIRRRQGTEGLRFKPMPQDDRNAIVHALVAHLMKKWEIDAQNDVSKLMHKAVADVFELDKVNKVLSPNNSFGLSAEDESTLGAVVKAMYQRTQLHLEDTGMGKDDKVGLSRAIEGNSDLRNQIGNRVSFKTNPLTSFTHDTDVADGWGRHHIVLKGGIPRSQIFFINNVMLQGGNNDVAEEFEVIVLGGELDVKVAKPNKSDGDL